MPLYASLLFAVLVAAAATVTTTLAAGPADTVTVMTTVHLDIQPRLQWSNYGGYCGETSLQMSALYYGAYISQLAARAAGGGHQSTGQLLLPLYPTQVDMGNGRNLVLAAAVLKLELAVFPSIAGAAQSKALMMWMKAQLLLGWPVIFGGYVEDCDPCDSDYDHIMPVIGFSSNSPATTATYQATDVLEMCSLYDSNSVKRTFSLMPAAPTQANRNACMYNTVSGGCIPLGTCYAVAVKGIKDTSGVFQPVRLAVDRNNEPNLSKGKAAVALVGTITVHMLTPGLQYRLMRYGSYVNVPTSGDAAACLKSRYDSFADFTATAAIWTYVDPTPIMSNSTTYYRCVVRV